MKARTLSMLTWVGLFALAGILSGCGAPRVIVVTATPTLAPIIQTVVVTPPPPTPTLTPSPTVPPSPTVMPEEQRIPVLSPIGLSEEPGPDGLTYNLDIPFRDADGDANLVHYSIVSSTSSDVQTEDGSIDVSSAVQESGARASGTWTCGPAEYTIVLAIEIWDAAGHHSAPVQVTLYCPGIEPTETPVPPTPIDSPTPEPTWTPSPPAQVVGSLPKTIPCQPEGVDTCLWDWVLTFTEKSGTSATVTSIGIRYIDVNGGVWVRSGGEWSTEDITIWGGSTNTYDSWVRSTIGNEGDLHGGTVKVSWEGEDAEGNAFSGSTSARLAAAP